MFHSMSMHYSGVKYLKLLNGSLKYCIQDSFFFRGFGLSGGVGGEGGAAVHSTVEHRSTLVSIELRCTSSHAVNFTVKLNKKIYI